MQRLLSAVKKKNRFSLEHLRELYTFLEANTVVTDLNRGVIVESIRDMAEVLIWGDQHNEAFFDFFLEKNMMMLLIGLLRQKDKELKIQLIQTLSILIENIRNNNSLYFLLSNNHINNMIAHEFDYGDEDLLAYYISFLKTLSLRLDNRSVHFFFNGQSDEFPLYTEAIKFFHNRESMIRIAVRVLTLNVYKIEDPSVRQFVLNRTASPYFGDLIWYIRRQCHLLDNLVLRSTYSDMRRVDDMIADLMDNFYYVQDILNLEDEPLNRVLARKVLDCLLLPHFCASLIQDDCTIEDKMSPAVALFLLAKMFYIFRHKPIVNTVADFLFHPEPQSDLQLEQSHASAPSADPSQSAAGEGSDSGCGAKSLPDACKSPTDSDCSTLGGNKYREALLNMLGQKNDTLVYFTELLIFSFIRNQDIDKELLEETGLLPYHLSQSRRLLDYLTTRGEKNSSGGPGGRIGALKGGHMRRCASVIFDKPLAVLAKPAKPRRIHPWCINLSETTLDAEGKPSPVVSNKEEVKSPEESEGAEEQPRKDNASDTETKAEEAESRKEISDDHARLVQEGHKFLRAVINRLFGVLLESNNFGLATLQMTLLLLKELVYSGDAPSLLTPRQSALLGEAYEKATENLKRHLAGPMAEIFLELFEDVLSRYKQPSFDRLIEQVDMLLPTSPTSNPQQSRQSSQPAGEADRTQCAVQSFLVLREIKFLLMRKRDDALPLKSLPMPQEKANQFLLLDLSSAVKFHNFHPGQKKPVHRYFKVVEGALLVLDVPEIPATPPRPQRNAGGQAEKPRSALINAVVPVQSIEVEMLPMPQYTLNLTCHQMRWAQQMQFEGQAQAKDARYHLEQARSHARQYKMRQIYAMVGIDISAPTSPETQTVAPEKPLAKPPRPLDDKPLQQPEPQQPKEGQPLQSECAQGGSDPVNSDPLRTSPSPAESGATAESQVQ